LQKMRRVVGKLKEVSTHLTHAARTRWCL
jgi:hypothetical protein